LTRLEENSEPAIEIRRLSFRYQGPTILQNVSLTIRSGEMVAIVGPNGGGKTTLLKLILGLLRAEHGEVQVFGRPPRRS
jgi:zinc transport system ATP-binding protein